MSLSQTDCSSILIASFGTMVGALSSSFCSRSLNKTSVGALIAAAAGMMVGCSIVLTGECVRRTDTVVAGVSLIAGISLMRLLDMFCSSYLDAECFEFDGLSGEKAVRVVIMFLSLVAHSIGEGFSLGLSAVDSSSTSIIVSSSLAVHNIPETAALMFSYRAKGLSNNMSVVLAVLSNLPQSIVALPALSFFASSRVFLEYGMGLSAGCMLYAVWSDVYPEAVESVGKSRALSIGSLASILVIIFDVTSHVHIRYKGSEFSFFQLLSSQLTCCQSRTNCEHC